MPVPSGVEAVKKPLLRNEIYSWLQGWILSGTLKPGEQLRDTDLSVRLGVSRTPVREALQMLEDEGLVETASGRWTRVSRVTLGEARELYPAIGVLEAHLAEAASARLDRHRLAELAEANAALGEALRRGDPGGAARADAAFHRTIWRPAGNATVAGLLQGLARKVSRLPGYAGLAPPALRDVLYEHERLLKALREGAAAAFEHWHRGLACLELLWPSGPGDADA